MLPLCGTVVMQVFMHLLGPLKINALYLVLQ